MANPRGGTTDLSHSPPCQAHPNSDSARARRSRPERGRHPGEAHRPRFKDVLGWQESDITRKAPAADGFADYSFGVEYKWFHVEAKRTAPRFELIASSRPRNLKLSGPHLLKNKQMRLLLEQAAKYTPTLGTQYAVLTNGSQFIVFEATPRGKSWHTGTAIVWHDYQDIEESFAEFYDLLARERVESGSLQEAFAKVGSITAPTFTPLDSIRILTAKSSAIRSGTELRRRSRHCS